MDRAESWEIDILDGATVKLTLAAGWATVTYSTADQIADWGTMLAPGASLTLLAAQFPPALDRDMPTETTLTIT